jgi:hypothetical protein
MKSRAERRRGKPLEQLRIKKNEQYLKKVLFEDDEPRQPILWMHVSHYNKYPPETSTRSSSKKKGGKFKYPNRQKL